MSLASFFENFSVTRWMSASSSIIGAAVGSPVLAAAATGQISWAQAAIPLVSSVIAILMPQSSQPPAPASADAQAPSQTGPGPAPMPIVTDAMRQKAQAQAQAPATQHDQLQQMITLAAQLAAITARIIPSAAPAVTAAVDLTTAGAVSVQEAYRAAQAQQANQTVQAATILRGVQTPSP